MARACERLGFEALFRSDHYGSVDGRRVARLARRVGDALRARRGHLVARLGTSCRRPRPASPPYWPRARSPPTTSRAGGSNSDRDGLAHGRAPRLRLPLSVHEGADGPDGRAARDHRGSFARGRSRSPAGLAWTGSTRSQAGASALAGGDGRRGAAAGRALPRASRPSTTWSTDPGRGRRAGGGCRASRGRAATRSRSLLAHARLLIGGGGDVRARAGATGVAGEAESATSCRRSGSPGRPTSVARCAPRTRRRAWSA